MSLIEGESIKYATEKDTLREIVWGFWLCSDGYSSRLICVL